MYNVDLRKSHIIPPFALKIILIYLFIAHCARARVQVQAFAAGIVGFSNLRSFLMASHKSAKERTDRSFVFYAFCKEWETNGS